MKLNAGVILDMATIDNGDLNLDALDRTLPEWRTVLTGYWTPCREAVRFKKISRWLRINGYQCSTWERVVDDADLYLGVEISRKFLQLEQPKPRKKTKPSRGALERRLKSKREHAERKQRRQKPGLD